MMAMPKTRRTRILPTLAGLFLAAALIRGTTGIDGALAAGSAPVPPLAPAPSASAPHDAPPPVQTRADPGSVDEMAAALVDLHRREQALAERETALAEQRAQVQAGQQRLQEQITALRAAERELSSTMALADRAAEDDIARLVAVFEAMKPEEAAPVFAEMDPEFAAGFLARLTPGAAADILAGLDPRLAYGLSAILAGRNALVPRN